EGGGPGVRVLPAVGVGLEVAQGGVEIAGLAAGEGEGAGGGADRGDVAGVEFAEPGGEPFLAVVAEGEFQQPGQVVQVLAGVIQVDDLGGFREVPGGEVPDPVRAVAQDDQLADVASPVAAGLARPQDAVLCTRGDSSLN